MKFRRNNKREVSEFRFLGANDFFDVLYCSDKVHLIVLSESYNMGYKGATLVNTESGAFAKIFFSPHGRNALSERDTKEVALEMIACPSDFDWCEK